MNCVCQSSVDGKADVFYSLAWAELFLITAMIVAHFDFTLYETTQADIEVVYDHFIPGVKSENGIRVTVKRVEST